jgi:hypothetical protein
MLTFKLNGNILEVIETTMTFHQDLKSYWYYDLVSWRKSSTGRQGAMIDRDIEPWQIEWIKKHYYSKVGLTSDLGAV